MGQDIALRRGRRYGDDGKRACEPAPRAAGHHRRRRHWQPTLGRRSVGDRELNRCSGVPVDCGRRSIIPARNSRSSVTAAPHRPRTLADLARWTGGDMRIASMPAHTSAAIEDLFTELRNQYLISFEPGERTGWHPTRNSVRGRRVLSSTREAGTCRALRAKEVSVVIGEKNHAEESCWQHRCWH